MTGAYNLNTIDARQLIVSELREGIKEAKNDIPRISTKNTLDLNKKIPITRNAIQSQAQLQNAIREAKGWAAGQPPLVKQGTSANDVFRMKNASTSGKFAAFETKADEASAFFKVGTGGEKAAGTMEKLMWDIAVIMGLEDQFVATGEAEIRDSSQLVLQGGIQIAQKGNLLWEYDGKLSKQEMTNGILASVVFGMFDAHSSNIFITEEGKIKFFDNTRSMPNSNGFINRGENLVSSYRCALLDRREAHVTLTNKEIEQLKIDVAAYKEKIGKLKEYFNTPQGQNQLKKLPPGWMDMEASLAAMEERVGNMQGALSVGKIQNLQQLVETSNPAYRFTFALLYLKNLQTGETPVTLPVSKVLQECHGQVGYDHSDDVLSNLALVGYDMNQIKNWCDDLSMPMDKLMDKVQSKYKAHKNEMPDGVEWNKRIMAAEIIKNEMFENAAMDLKDWDRNSCEKSVIGFNQLKFLSSYGITKITLKKPATLNDAIETMKKNIVEARLVMHEGKATLIYNSSSGYQTKEIDLRAKPGYVKVEDKLMKIEDFIKIINLTKIE
ncbi:MAG: hypothetical protein H0V82_12670 [Candidatus Protochlamydia sp.]|nr:hypothetical protein [Candidatus Protochlamydia sp.]